jgi:hypothetical protein
MSLGIGNTKSDVDNRSGLAAIALRDAFVKIKDFQTYLAATPDATLTAAPYGFTQQEVNTLKSAFNDLDLLRTIFEGIATQLVLKDFRTFAKQLWNAA